MDRDKNLDRDIKDIDMSGDNQSVEDNTSTSDFARLSSSDDEDGYDEPRRRVVTYVYTEEDFEQDCAGSSHINQDSASYCLDVARRANFFLFFLFIVFSIIFLKILSLQLNSEGFDLRNATHEANYKHFPIKPKRGDILSVNHEIMTSSVMMYKVFMDLREEQLSDKAFNENYSALADSLSVMFGDKSPVAYRDSLKSWRKRNLGNKAVTPYGKLIDYNDLERMRTFPILCNHPFNGGAKKEVYYVRKNYYGALGRKIIGAEQTQNVNGSGIELSFNNYLKGEVGSDYRRKVSGALWLPVDNPENRPAVDGYNVVSTIDVDIQDIAANSLYNMMDKNEVDWGTVVVMDVKSGEIRAMANLSRTPKTRKLEENYNHAIGTSVEPGSTYKLIPLLALLEQRGASLDTIIDTKRGYDVINGIAVSDSHGYGKIPFKTCMSKSSNVGFARIMDNNYRNSPQDFIDFLEGLGIADDIDFQLEGEARPIFRDTKNPHWSKADLVTMSYGYATQFTALRILMLYNAIANNGKLITPIIVKEILDGDRVVDSFTSNVINDKICSDETLKKVKIALEDVMYDGTVRSVFKNESYVVAGKTGTSRQVGDNGKYDQDNGRNYLASFVGYFPANNPQYTCIVQMKTFKPFRVNRQYYGAGLAAPVFKDISHFISTKSSWGHAASDYAKQKETEFISEWKKVDAMQGIRKSSKDYFDHGDKSSAGGTLSVGGDYDDITILKDNFNLDNYKLSVNSDNSLLELGEMPNVIGMGLDDALATLERCGLDVTVKGRGRVKAQSIKAGVSVKAGTRVLISLDI